MLQESGIPGELRVREVIDLFRSYYPRPLATDDVIEKAGLGEKQRALVKSLSGGQRQRLYFALAISGDPEVLFLDEPTVGLDVDSRRSFWAQVRDAVGAGKTVILTTHYLEEADALADRIVVIDRGTVIVEGTAASIKSRVAHKRVRFDTETPLRSGLLDGLSVSQFEVSGRTASFVSPEPEAALSRVFGAGYEVSGLEVVGADLEEAFLEITGGEA